MYKLIIKPKAEKQLRKLPHKDQSRIGAVLDHLMLDPFFGKKLDGHLDGYYAAKVWPYRIVYIIEKKIVTVTVVTIGHRKDVYERLR
jgi:mRNA interferase RelE/StbE